MILTQKGGFPFEIDPFFKAGFPAFAFIARMSGSFAAFCLQQ